jgi:hypothetical protein
MHKSARLAATGSALVALAIAASVNAGAARKFVPRDGLYAGSYTNGAHGSGGVRLRVRPVPQPHPRFPGVELVRWSGKMTCSDGSTVSTHVKMTAARTGKTFSGYVTYATGYRNSLTGKFTSATALEGTARVTIKGGTGADCQTGPVRFTATRAGP